MRKITSLLLFIAALLLPFSSLAYSSNVGRWYQVELIIFSHITPQGLMSEQWPWTDPNYKQKSRSISLNTNTDLSDAITDIPFVVLPRKDFVMKSEEARINKKTGYHVLLHLAWKQQARSPKSALPIHIFGGNLYSPAGKVIATDQYGTLPYDNSPIWQINGTLKISVLRYLNVNLNLVFAAPVSQLSSAFRDNDMNNVLGRFAYFRLLQTRRMRSKELNYIGHPLYGVLVKVKPLKNKEPNATQQ